MKRHPNISRTIVLSLTVALSSCSSGLLGSTHNPLLQAGGEQRRQGTRMIYFSVQTESTSHHRLSQTLLDQLRRFAKRQDFVAIDQQQGDAVHILYSSPANRRQINQINGSLLPGIHARDTALLASLRRLRQYSLDASVPVHAIIVTSGSQDAETLLQVENIISEIPPDALQSLCLVGLDAAKRESTSKAFLSLRHRVVSGQGEIEWKKCIQEIRK